MRVCVVAGLSRSLLDFHGPLLAAIQARGHELVAIALIDEGTESVGAELANRSIEFEPVSLARGGHNPRHDLASIRQLQKVFERLRPDVVLAYTVKPVIYSGIAARRVGNIRFFPLITGLGYRGYAPGPRPWSNETAPKGTPTGTDRWWWRRGHTPCWPNRNRMARLHTACGRC